MFPSARWLDGTWDPVEKGTCVACCLSGIATTARACPCVGTAVPFESLPCGPPSSRLFPSAGWLDGTWDPAEKGACVACLSALASTAGASPCVGTADPQLFAAHGSSTELGSTRLSSVLPRASPSGHNLMTGTASASSKCSLLAIFVALLWLVLARALLMFKATENLRLASSPINLVPAVSRRLLSHVRRLPGAALGFVCSGPDASETGLENHPPLVPALASSM
ncbi:hypothetical protein FB451DRAFT_1235271 [Mycena latifolia]|nr:hypothetical protein FB451DRAFT_1235271 [Mycena latifolia]